MDRAKSKKGKGFDALGGEDVEPKGLTFWNPEKIGDYICGVLNNKITTKLNYQMFIIIGAQEHNQDESIALPSHVDLMMRLENVDMGTLVACVFDGKEGRQYKYRVKKLF